MNILNNQKEPKNILKRYRVEVESTTVAGQKTEGFVWAENEESAKEKVLNSMLKEEFGGAFLDSPLQIITAEEVTLPPHNITNIIDNMAEYIDDIRHLSDSEKYLSLLTQYVTDYFKNVEFSREHARSLAIFGVDRTYRVVTTLDPVDKYTRFFLARVMSLIWAVIQKSNINVFYIVDNTFSSDAKFETMVEMFQLMGFAVVMPYSEHGNLMYEEMEKQIKNYMADSKMIMYVEKDTSVNYIDNVKTLAKESNYLCMFRNKAANISLVELVDSKIS